LEKEGYFKSPLKPKIIYDLYQKNTLRILAVNKIRHTREEKPSLLKVFFICKYWGMKETTGPNIITKLRKRPKIPILAAEFMITL
jgi:hypothetical protein